MVGGSLESKDRRHSHWTLEHVGILSGHAGSKAWQKPAHVRQGDPMPARANQFEQFGCREIGRSAQRQPGGPPPVYPVFLQDSTITPLPTWALLPWGAAAIPST